MSMASLCHGIRVLRGRPPARGTSITASSAGSGGTPLFQNTMFTDIESVKAVVNAAIDAEKPPRPSQLSDICRLTYFNDARQEVQRMVDRRLKHPYKYNPLVVLHILILVQYCLLHASSDFIHFCIAQAKFVSMLVQYEDVGTPVAKEIAGYARLLSKALSQPTEPSNTTKTVSAPKVVAFPNPLTVATKQEENAPAPWQIPLIQGPPKKEDISVVPDIQIKLLPAPDLTPHPVPDPPPAPAASVLLMEKESVAMMTFQRDRKGLVAVLSAVDDLANRKSSIRRHPDDLIKALKCVLYCLYWGSTPFLAQCKGKQTIFDLLYLYHHSHQVRGHAYEVFNFLKDPKQNEIEKYPLVHYQNVSPSIQRAILGARGVPLESNIDISKAVIITEREPFARSVYSDLWGGAHRTKTGELPVAIKVLRTLRNVYPNQLSRNLQREFLNWQSLQHKNVSPFYGVFVDDLAVGLVWPLYRNGNVVNYYSETDQAVSLLALLRGIADGVLYLHAKGIVHGNIKCSNVMVSDEGTPRLIDFGLFRVSNDDAGPTGYNAASLGSSLRWSAPEILIGDSPVTSRSEKSDVYALASTCIELTTLEVPYRGLSDEQVLSHVAIKGKFPPRPSPLRVEYLINDMFWRFLTSCWSVRPMDRPNIVAMRRKLDEITEDVPIHPDLTRKKTRLRWPGWKNRKLQG